MVLTMSQSSWRSSPSWARRGRDGRRREGGEIFLILEISASVNLYLSIYICVFVILMRRRGDLSFFNTGDISICVFLFVYMYLCICNTNEKEGGFVSLNTGDISICVFVFVYMNLCICNTNEKEGGLVFF